MRMVYFARLGDKGPIKIGESVNPERRMEELEMAFQTTATLLASIKNGDEAAIHRQFDHCRCGVRDLVGYKLYCMGAGSFEVFHPRRDLMDFIDAIRMTPERIKRAGALLNSGKSGPLVAKALKVSTASIYKYWKQAGPGKFVRKKRKAG